MSPLKPEVLIHPCQDEPDDHPLSAPRMIHFVFAFGMLLGIAVVALIGRGIWTLFHWLFL